jgi:hypothetical protein
MLTISDPPFVLDISDPKVPFVTVPEGFKWPTDTEECVALSAKKWEFVGLCCRALREKVRGGLTSGTCALCRKFGRDYNDGSPGCETKEENCPVAAANHWGCTGTEFVEYCGAQDWVEASRIALKFADFLVSLKPSPKTAPFKGFCVGTSHDGYVGIKLTSVTEGTVVLEADIDHPANCLVAVGSEGVSLEEHIAPSAPFADLLNEQGALKQV